MTVATTLARPATLACVHLVAWGNAALDGRTSLDEAATAGTEGRTHRVRGLDADATPVSLAYAFGRLRALGATRLSAVLPVAGDVAGLPGPPAFNEAALAAGAAVIVAAPTPLGLLPAAGEASIEWTATAVPGTGASGGGLSEAQQVLTRAISETTAELAGLDVAPWQAQTAPTRRRDRDRADRAVCLPPGHPPEAVRLAMQAIRLLEVVELALADDGGAVSAPEARRRREALLRLHGAARRALAAAATGG